MGKSRGERITRSVRSELLTSLSADGKNNGFRSYPVAVCRLYFKIIVFADSRRLKIGDKRAIFTY